MVYINRPLFNGLKEIDDNIVQKIYVEAINKINITQVKCCQHHGGSFIIHGYYRRRIKRNESIADINILRIKCEYCNKTHAVFFNDIIPYSMFNAYEFHKILLNQIDKDFSYEIIERVRRIKPIVLARIKLLGLLISDDISMLLKWSIHSFCGHILQIHRGRIVDYLFESG